MKLEKIAEITMENTGAGDDNQSRKYVLWFGSRSIEDFNDDSLLAQKARCANFWKFVDSQPKLQSLIKKGEPIYTTATATAAEKPEKKQNNQKASAAVVKNEIKVKNSTSTRSDYDDDYEDCRKIEEEKGILLRARHQEQRMRIARQREKTLELERKSGQIRPKARTKEKKPPSWKVLSDISEGRESAIMTAYQEMSTYDEIKNVQNKKPSKSKSNTISQISELDSDQEEMASKILLGNDDAESVEIEEIFLKNSDKK